MRSLKGRLIFLGILVAIGLCVAAFFGIRYMMREGELSPFRPVAESYTAVPLAPPEGAPRVVGKVLPVNFTDRKPDHLYFDLPADLRASRPEEVGTVVLLIRGKTQVATYQGGGGAFQQFCEVTLVDHRTRAVLHKQIFQGGPPPQSISSRSSTGTGSSPDPSVVDFLTRLP